MEVHKEQPEQPAAQPIPKRKLHFMTSEQYVQMLLEVQYLSQLLRGLQMTEQQIMGKLADRRFNKDIYLNSQLPRVREDIKSLQQCISVQQNLINTEIQRMYEIKFKSFKVQNYDDILEEVNRTVIEKTKAAQISKQEDGVQRADLRQQEGSDVRPDPGPETEGAIQPSGSD